MTRVAVVPAALALGLLACRPAASDPGIEHSVVVSDSLGTLVGGAVPSPDGTRLAFSRTLAGKAAIFLSAPDGSNPVRLTQGVWDVEPYWSPDGRWIAYHAEAPEYDVMLVSVDGGEPRRLTSGPAFEFPRGWLRDGSAIVVARTGQGDDHTILVPLDGGAPRRLGPVMAGNQHAAISPDGTKLAFDVHQGSRDATIWVQDLAGGEPRQLTTENLEVLNPQFAWSPDGRFLSYASRRTGTQDIYVLDLTTGESRQLTTDVRDDNQPRWSPDGRWIAFLSDRGGQRDLWVVAASGGNAVRVTNDRAVEQNVQWSPDGRRLYFQRIERGVELRLLPSDSGAARTLLSWPGSAVSGAALSPDGHTVLFASNRSGNDDIWSLSLGGGEPAVFAGSPLQDNRPGYSPDGSQVLFTSDRAGSPDLWIAPVAGGEPRRLTQASGNEGLGDGPRWSPDGKTIAFVSNEGVGGGDLWVIPSAGGEATRLTRDNLRPGNLDWSPDGRWIYFNGSRQEGGRQVYRIAPSGGKPESLGAPLSEIGGSDLSPDGSQLAFWTFEGGWAFTSVMPAAGGAVRRLTRETENVYQPGGAWSPDGAFLAVSDLDFPGNRDEFDVTVFRVSDGTSRRLTRTVRGSEYVVQYTPDGKQILVVLEQEENQIRSIPIAELLAGAGRP